MKVIKKRGPKYESKIAVNGNDFPRYGFAREREVLRFVGFGRTTLWAKANLGASGEPPSHRE